MKYKLLPIILSGLLLVGCNSNDKKPVTPPEPEDEYEEFEIDFTAFDLSPYSNLLQSKDARFNSALLSYIQESTGDIVASFTSSGENRERLSVSEFPSGYTNVQGLIIGSGEQDGEINLTFSKKLISVTFEIEQYYKIYVGYDFGSAQDEIKYDCQRYDESIEDYVGYSTITANDERWEGTGVTYHYFDDYTGMYIDLPETNTATIEINSNYLNLEALGAERCRIYKMTLKFEK